MNQVTLIGRLTKDPEVRQSQGTKPTAIASFSIAVDRRFKRQGEPEADFFDCRAFGPTADFIGKNMIKGLRVAVQGRIQNNNYTNREGQKVYGMQIVVDNIEFADGRPDSKPAQAQAAPTPAPAPAPAPAAAAATAQAFAPTEDEMDLPFN